MAHYKVTLLFDGNNVKSVAKKAKEFFGGDADVSVEKSINPVSRSDRLSIAESEVENARMSVEELRDEMQNWLDSIPENLQDGQKAGEVQEALDALEEIVSNLEDVDFSSVSFPGMF